MKDNRRGWYGHVMRREELITVRMVKKINVGGKRGRGNPCMRG